MARRSGEAALVALDTTCVVAAAAEWHDRHAVTVSALERWIDAGSRLLVPAHAATEAYSVLTRMPLPLRFSPANAWRILAEFEKVVETVALGASEYWSLLRTASARAVQGGRIYDAVIAACAKKAGATVILTLNTRHFDSFADESLTIACPA